MAEITLPQKSGKRKLPLPRIDLTPMVDLGFLLITFFMYTTTMTKSKVMDINLPTTQAPPEPTSYPEESTMTVIPVSNHKIIYYSGTLKTKEQLHITSFSATHGIRDILIQKQTTARQLPATFSADAHKLHILIKPADNSTYDDVVKILDEMNILAVPCYAMLDVSAEEKELIAEVKNNYGK